MTNIFVIGYYGHDNIGDEQYKISFEHIFHKFLPNRKSYNIEYLDCDSIKCDSFSDTDIIIIGGGDILNHYFLDQINDKFKGKPNKIIAISVGLPYNEILINTNKLSIIDYIFIRTQQDFTLFSQYYRSDRIFYLPDISYYLTEENIDNSVHDSNYSSIVFKQLDLIKRKKRKIIAFCLNRHIYTKETKKKYGNIVVEFYKTIKLLIEQGFYIVLLPFNTCEGLEDDDSNMENDIIFHTEIFNLLDVDKQQSVLNIDTNLSVKQTFKLFDYFYISVPMRFHACLFSIYKNVPMIPVFTTKKISNFLLDIKWNIFYQLNTDSKDLPYELDSQLLFSKINQLFIDQNNPNSNRNPNRNREKFFGIISHCFNSDSSCKTSQESNAYIDNQNILTAANHKFQETLEYEIQTVMDVISIPFTKECTMGFSNNTNVIIEQLIKKLKEYIGTDNLKLEEITDYDKKTKIVSMVSYYLTKGYDSKYNHGLMEKMFHKNYDYSNEWSWIIKDLQMTSTRIKSNEDGIYNMNFIDQMDYSDSHRSGWQYIINSVKSLNNEKSNLYLDLSVDKTFHWKNDINKIIGILPYTRDWVGFIHHTFDTTFSEYNNVELLKNELFIESLKYCKGLIVLSNSLKLQLEEELFIKLNHLNPKVKVSVICHPTEFVNESKLFSWKKFLANDDKKLIHIGGWLRNVFSFYALSIPLNYEFFISGRKNSHIRQSVQGTIRGQIKKVALKGRNMDNYFPSEDIKISSIAKNHQNQHKNCSQNDDSDSNNWTKHLIEFTKNVVNTVEILERVSDEEYDELLTENIVFINLVDASTVNTILECIVRNTPIIVNKIPAVVELLGENYPLYFDSDFGHINEQVSILLFDTRNLKLAHKYLKAMDKSKFSIEYFMKDLTEIIKSI
jgi:polysaccharide pyruvyl transferase WcaK-like protein